MGVKFENFNVFSMYQLIFSLKTLDIIGFEALCRAKDQDRMVFPNELFLRARQTNKILDLDIVCRESALLHRKDLPEDRVLFLNVDISYIKDVSNIENIVKLIRESNINPNYVCIELLESEQELKAISKAVKIFRYYGLLVAIDDFGKGGSDFQRLSYIKPDIIKIDMSLIRDIQFNHNKHIIVKHIASIGHSLGALILAEGIEQKEEFFTCMDVGIDMYQGFLLSKPNTPDKIEINTLKDTFENLVYESQAKRLENYRKYKEKLSIYKHIFDKIANDALTLSTFETYIKTYDFIQSIYLLDENGIMVYDTIYQRNHIKPIFKPAKKSDNLSFKDYFMIAKEFKDSDYYISEPYISQISGRFCITISKVIKGYVLCVDFSM